MHSSLLSQVDNKASSIFARSVGRFYHPYFTLYIQCSALLCFQLNHTLSTVGYKHHSRKLCFSANSCTYPPFIRCLLFLHLIIDRVVYERASWNPVLASALFSAWWHGFYPGYYLACFSFGISLMAARKV